MKIIFLDLDGVMNCSRDFYEVRKYGHPTNNVKTGKVLNRGCIALLESIILETDAKIVFSTNWRRRYSDRELFDFLVEAGFRLPDTVVHGRTPIIGMRSRKGAEVREWLDENPEIETFLILDDDDEGLDYHFTRFDFDIMGSDNTEANWIQTRFDHGLLEIHAHTAVNLLGRNEEYQKKYDEFTEGLELLTRCIV